MRTLVGLRSRILFSALSGGALSLAVLFVALGWLGWSARRELLQELPSLVGEAELRRCEEAPELWRLERAALRIYAYELERGGSRNPQAPPLSPEILARLQAGEGLIIFRESPLFFPRISGAVRVGEGGCGALVARPLTPEVIMPELPKVLLGALSLGTALVLAGAMLVAVRPLVARLRRLAAAAEAVGTPAFSPPSDPEGDDLGRISTILGEAHRRITADREELDLRRRALERHLEALAHDLRTPLTSLHLSLESAAATADPETRRAVDQATLECAYLVALTDNLHLAARLRHGFDPLAGGPRCDLAALVSRVALRFQLLGRASGALVRAQVPSHPLFVACDPALAERAVSNLAHNALVHGRPGGQVALRLEPSGAARFRLSVSDDGPGLPPERWQALIERGFAPGPARTRGSPQAGLGLLITGEISRRVGWRLYSEALQPCGLRAVIEGAVLPP